MIKAQVSSTKTEGFALLEVLIAILIFSIGIMGLIGIQASSIRAQVDSKNRSQATLLANQVVADIWTQVGTSTTTLSSFNKSYSATLTPSDPWGIALASSPLPNAVLTVDTSNAPEVTITITWQKSPAEAAHSFDFTTQINTQ